MSRDDQRPPPPQSIADVVEALVTESGGQFTGRTVTTVVMRLSRDGAASLPELAELARQELRATATRENPQAPGP